MSDAANINGLSALYVESTNCGYDASAPLNPAGGQDSSWDFPMMNLGWIGATGNFKVILEEKFGGSYYLVETYSTGLALSDFTSG